MFYGEGLEARNRNVLRMKPSYMHIYCNWNIIFLMPIYEICSECIQMKYWNDKLIWNDWYKLMLSCFPLIDTNPRNWHELDSPYASILWLYSLVQHAQRKISIWWMFHRDFLWGMWCSLYYRVYNLSGVMLISDPLLLTMGIIYLSVISLSSLNRMYVFFTTVQG